MDDEGIFLQSELGVRIYFTGNRDAPGMYYSTTFIESDQYTQYLRHGLDTFPSPRHPTTVDFSLSAWHNNTQGHRKTVRRGKVTIFHDPKNSRSEI
jgi:hypothetical protein